MSAAEFRIQSLSIDEGIVAIVFASPDDLRAAGNVAVGRQVQFSLGHPDYAEDMELIERQIVKMLRNVLDDWESSERFVPSEDDSDEDDEFGSRGRNE